MIDDVFALLVVYVVVVSVLTAETSTVYCADFHASASVLLSVHHVWRAGACFCADLWL